MFFRILFFTVIFGLSTWSFPCNAQVSNDLVRVSLPVEVALTYQKRAKITPDFEALVKQAPAYINAPDFAKKVVLYQEAKKLEAIFNNITEKSSLVVFDDLKIKEFNRKKKTERTSDLDLGDFSFEGFDFNKHYLYEYNDELYVIFIKNFEDYTVLPIQKKASSYLSSAFMRNTTAAAELTLKPEFVDDKPFMLDDGREANLILTNIVDIKLIQHDSGKVVYHDIAVEWKPKSRIDKLIKEIVKNNKF